MARHYGYRPIFGPTEENPYLGNFSEDMRRWSFNMMVYTLYANIRQLNQLHNSGESFVRDRSLYDDSAVFVPNLQSMGLMTTRDMTTYTKLFDLMYSLLPKPDLIVYLRADVTTLIRHIQKRGREMEASIRLDYLNNLNDRYEQWASQYTGRLLVVDTDGLDFVESKQDLGTIINRIDAELNGLFAEL